MLLTKKPWISGWNHWHQEYSQPSRSVWEQNVRHFKIKKGVRDWAKLKWRFVWIDSTSNKVMHQRKVQKKKERAWEALGRAGRAKGWHSSVSLKLKRMKREKKSGWRKVSGIYNKNSYCLGKIEHMYTLYKMDKKKEQRTVSQMRTCPSR